MKFNTPVAIIAFMAGCATTPAFPQAQNTASAAAPGQIDYTYNKLKTGTGRKSDRAATGQGC